MFDGTDSLVWIFKMERYFEVHHRDDISRMMEIILLCMSGQALAWFQCFRNWGKPPESWDEFRPALYMLIWRQSQRVLQFHCLAARGEC